MGGGGYPEPSADLGGHLRPAGGAAAEGVGGPAQRQARRVAGLPLAAVPQIALVVTRTIASAGSWILGSGTSSTETFPTSCQTTAFVIPLSVGFR
jgi:hypothetical protein